MSGTRKPKPFGIVFDPASQPGWMSRAGASARQVLAVNQIVGSQPKDHPEPYTADQVLAERENLRQRFVSMQVPQLMPSQIYRKSKR